MEQPIGACTILINTDGKILLGKRKNGYKAGFYGLPGGHVGFTEVLEIGARRELAEETGLTDLTMTYIGLVREKQEHQTFIHFVFTGTEFRTTPELTEPEKCEKWEWFEITHVPEKILPGHKAAIEMYHKGETLSDI